MSCTLLRRPSALIGMAILVGAMAVARPVSAQLTVQVGDLFPDFSALDQDNVAFTLSAQQGKVVLLHVCSMWCAPCRQSAEDEQLISDALDAAIGADHWLLVDALVENINGDPTSQLNANQWINAFDTPALTLHGAGDPGSNLSQLAPSIGLAQFPTYFIIAPDGRVSAIHVGYVPTSSNSPPFDHDAAVLFQLVIDALPAVPALGWPGIATLSLALLTMGIAAAYHRTAKMRSASTR